MFKYFGFLNFSRMVCFDADDDGGGSGGSAGENDQDKNKTQTGGGELTQEQVDVLLGKTRKEASERATKKLLEDLGVDDLETAKKVLKERKAREDAEKSELEKLQQAHKELEDKHAKAIKDNETLLLRQEFYAQARSMNLEFANDQARKDAFTAAKKDDAKIDDEGNVSGMEGIIKALLKSHPHLFGKLGEQAPDIDALKKSGGKDESGKITDARKEELRKRGFRGI